MGQERLWESVERKDKKKKKIAKTSGRQESGREGNRTRERGEGGGEKSRDVKQRKRSMSTHKQRLKKTSSYAYGQDYDIYL